MFEHKMHVNRVELVHTFPSFPFGRLILSMTSARMSFEGHLEKTSQKTICSIFQQFPHVFGDFPSPARSTSTVSLRSATSPNEISFNALSSAQMAPWRGVLGVLRGMRRWGRPDEISDWDAVGWSCFCKWVLSVVSMK